VQRGGKSEKKVATEDPWFHSDVVGLKLFLDGLERALLHVRYSPCE
jgi:hypothetical protein